MTHAARHEAAHALLAWLCGHDVKLDIEARDGYGGLCEVLNPDCSTTDQLLISMGGIVADGSIEASWQDVVDAVMLAAEIRPDDPAAELRSAHVAAVNLLSRPRLANAHERLARALDRHRALDPHRVDAVIRSGLRRPLASPQRSADPDREPASGPPDTA